MASKFLAMQARVVYDRNTVSFYLALLQPAAQSLRNSAYGKFIQPIWAYAHEAAYASRPKAQAITKGIGSHFGCFQLAELPFMHLTGKSVYPTRAII
jgi:hypothetical protein